MTVVRGYTQTLTYHAAASASSSFARRVSPDRALFHPAPCSTVPFRRDPHYVDRNILTEIEEKGSQPAARVALVGLGGVGKSQIPIEYSYRVRDKSPSTWVFWVHAGSQARFEEGYQRIAEAMRMDGWNNPKVNILRLVRAWLSDGSNGKWVMIIDNADDMDVFLSTSFVAPSNESDTSTMPAPLLEFIPQSTHGSIVITSRSRDVAYRLTGSSSSSIIEIRPMNHDEALSLLRKKISSHADKDSATELLQSVDYMPLAITQAAAYIDQRAPRMTISRYVDKLRRSDDDRARMLKMDVGDSRRDGRSSNSIIATWHVSFEHIQRDRPSATRLLSLMSLFDRQGIPDYILHGYHAQYSAESDFEEDLHILISFSLIRPDLDGHQFEMHRLVQFSTRKWLDLQAALEGWKEKFVMLLNDRYPVGQYENWVLCRALFPHARAAVDCRPTEHTALETWGSLFFKAGWYAWAMGQYSLAKKMGFDSLEARRSALGPEHPDTLETIEKVAVVLAAQGKYKEAEKMQRAALEAYMRLLGPEDIGMLSCMSNLAYALASSGNMEEALALNSKVTEARKRVLGVEHQDTLLSIANLATTYSALDKPKEAEALYREGLQTCRRILGDDHPYTMMTLGNLAATISDQERWEEASTLCEQAVEASERILGPEHPDGLIYKINLGVIYSKMGRLDESKKLGAHMLEMSEKVMGAEHPTTLMAMVVHAAALKAQHRLEEAITLLEHTCEVRSRVLGAEHTDTKQALNLLEKWEQEGVDRVAKT